MSIENRPTLKSYFQTGDKPTEAQFASLIDTAVAVVESIDGLITDTSNLANGAVIYVNNFYSTIEGGGGAFRYDANGNKANHDGIDIIDPTHSATPGAPGSTWWTNENTGTTGVFIRSWKPQVNVRDAGAKGDDSNDDTDAIQAAIDLATNDGRSVFIPNGTYQYDTAFTINATGLRVSGESKRNAILKRTAGSQDCFTINNASRDIIFSDLYIYGQGVDASLFGGTGINADYGGIGGNHNIFLENIIIDDWHEYAMQFQGVNGLWLKDILVQDPRRGINLVECSDVRGVQVEVLGAYSGGNNMRIEGGSAIWFNQPNFNAVGAGNNLQIVDVGSDPGNKLSFVGGRVSEVVNKVNITGSANPIFSGQTFVADTEAVETFTDGDTTPDVQTANIFKTANTTSTTITDFDNGYEGQTIKVIINDANTTIDFTGTNLKGNAGVDWSPTTDDHMTCVRSGSTWYCDISDNTA